MKTERSLNFRLIAEIALGLISEKRADNEAALEKAGEVVGKNIKDPVLQLQNALVLSIEAVQYLMAEPGTRALPSSNVRELINLYEARMQVPASSKPETPATPTKSKKK